MKKKFMCLLLFVGITVMLSGCGKVEENVQNRKEPTEAEMEMINEYLLAYGALEGYAESGEISFYDEEECDELMGNDALQKWYQVLNDMDEVDEWEGSTYLADVKTREELLESFDIVEDVLVKTTTTWLDRMGNDEGEGGYTNWYYDQDGKLVNTEVYKSGAQFMYLHEIGISKYFWADKELFYDENGRMEEAKCTSDGEVVAEASFEYTANGQLVKETIKHSDGDNEVTYTYNAAGNLVSVESVFSPIDGLESYVEERCECSYDKQGRLVAEEYEEYGAISRTRVAKIKYVYKENEVLPASASFVADSGDYITYEEDAGIEYTFTYDEKGRFLNVEEEYVSSGRTRIREYEYSDYCLYVK